MNVCMNFDATCKYHGHPYIPSARPDIELYIYHIIVVYLQSGLAPLFCMLQCRIHPELNTCQSKSGHPMPGPKHTHTHTNDYIPQAMVAQCPIYLTGGISLEGV